MEPEIETETYFLYEVNCPSLLTDRNQACIARSACVRVRGTKLQE